MATFDDWGAEYAEDFEYDANLSVAREAQADAAVKSLGLVTQGIKRASGAFVTRDEALKHEEEIRNKILTGRPLNPDEIDLILPPPGEQTRLQGLTDKRKPRLPDGSYPKMITPEMVSFWKVIESKEEVRKQVQKVQAAEAKRREKVAQLSKQDLFAPGSTGPGSIVAGLGFDIEQSDKEIARLQEDQIAKRAEATSAVTEFRTEADKLKASDISPTAAARVTDPRMVAGVKAARAAELARGGEWGGLDPNLSAPIDLGIVPVPGQQAPKPQDLFGEGFQDFVSQYRGQQRTEETRDLGDYLSNLYAGTTGTTAAPAAPGITAAPDSATVGVPGEKTAKTLPLEASEEKRIRDKWTELGMGGQYNRLREAGESPSKIDADFERYSSLAKEAGYETVSEYFQKVVLPGSGGVSGVDFGPKGIETGPQWPTPWSTEDPEGLKQFLSDADAMPSVREMLFERQEDPTVWSRLGMEGLLASDPYTGDPVSTQQLSGVGREALEDWYYRTVQPRYAFKTAEARQQRALGLDPKFQPGFEAFARTAPTRGRITPEEALRGQQAVIAALQAPRDVLDPYSQELFAYFDEKGGVDSPQNQRLIEALAAPTLSQISARYRRPATARIQQELRNRMVMQPEQQMLSFFTGEPAMRPDVQPGSFAPLPGGQRHPWE